MKWQPFDASALKRGDRVSLAVRLADGRKGSVESEGIIEQADQMYVVIKHDGDETLFMIESKRIHKMKIYK